MRSWGSREKLFGATLLFTVAATLAFRRFFGHRPPGNFSDLYLLGVLVVSCYCSWIMSAVLLLVSTVLAIFLLSPLDWRDGFQIVSYTASASVIVLVMALLRRRSSTRGNGQPSN